MKLVKSTFVALSAFAVLPAVAYAEGVASEYLPLGVGILMAVAVLGGTLGQSKAISAGLEAIGRNPTAKNAVFTPMIVGLALIESLVILGFVIAYLMLG